MIARKILCCMLLAALIPLLPISSSPAEAQQAQSIKETLDAWDVEIGATLDLNGKYIWRGQTLVDDPVLQPGASISAKGFTASFWGNYTLQEDREWTEYDYALDYTTALDVIHPSLEKVSASAGYIFYDFPNISADNSSQEVYASIGVDTLLSPSVAVYHDFDEGDGTYYEASVSHSVPLDKLSLNLGTTVGYNDGQWGYDSSFSAALFSASVTIPFTERVSLEPGVFYSLALDNQYDDEFYAGFSLAIQLWD